MINLRMINLMCIVIIIIAFGFWLGHEVFLTLLIIVGLDFMIYYKTGSSFLTQKRLKK